MRRLFPLPDATNSSPNSLNLKFMKMILRDLLLCNKKISFEITNDMGNEVLVDSENIPDNLVEIFHEQIESWLI